MLTTPDEELETAHCYDLGGNVYITKPVLYRDFAGAVRQLGVVLCVVQVPRSATK